MRGAARVLGGLSLEQAEPVWTHMSTYKLKKALKMGNFGIDRATNGVPGKCGGGGVIGEQCGRSAWGMSLERAKRTRKGFEGGVRGEVGGNRSWCPSTCMLFQPCG